MDISTIFKSKVRKALFRLYFTNPESEYYLRELERVLGMPVAVIRKELTRLEKDGIFVSRKKANLVFYSVNKSYPLFDELKSMISKTVGVTALLRDVLKKIKGVKTAFIYGSFAKNNENYTSDIDLFVMGEINENALIRTIKKIENMLKREINYTLYTRSEFLSKKRKKDTFIIDLLENPKIMLIGEESDLR